MLARARRLLLLPPHTPRALSTTTATPAPLSAAELEALLRRDHYSAATRRFHSLLPLLTHPSLLLASALLLRRRSHPSLPLPLSSPLNLPTPLPTAPPSPSYHLRLILPSRLKAAPLPFPTLPLHLSLVTAAATLSAVFAPRAATFAYRARHAAVRYLRAIPNPSWFFRLAIPRQRFSPRHVRRLLATVSAKIDDPGFLDYIHQLFLSDAVAFDLGGNDLGRGFPQESDLAATLLNIFFDPVDREVMAVREEVHKRNPRVKDESVLHTPVRVYAARYLDEMMVVTSGSSKMLTLEVRDRILTVLEKDLEVKVDRLGSSVHSAVSEKMEFLGMEFQAVPPSVLHPPMSEKAKRERKMYLKRKAAQAQELKNARETRRKKLGLKILNYLFKKVRRGYEVEFGFRIEHEVRQQFKGWAEETVAEYFKSQDHCRYWHRLLMSGDFLSLNRVRDQLPPALVDSYDKLQETVDRFLMPMKGHDMTEDKERLAEEEDERQYEKRTVEDLTELKMRVNAPMELVRKAVKLAGFTNSMGRPRPIKLLLCLDDADIIKWYAGVGRRWLDFFCCCRNFRMVKIVVSYHLRFSCFLTLAEKHECTKRQAIRHYTKDLKVTNEDGAAEVYFPTEREIKMMGDKNLSDPKPVDGALTMILVRFAVNDTSYPCLAHFCTGTDTLLYRIRLLQNRLNVDPLNEKKWVQGLSAIHESVNKKCLPLCAMHASDLLLGKITLQDIDCTQFVDVE
ncbi:nuclear intron maturase 3, mitochondrial [Brachypodium distachyon]|uniref:Domain X domain-containing protein n=1 Tax=Brachypodium distachyon TaxID=15368 RepID=A0A0Q3RVE4_BRADI|nr:nuclear intron maturase 3, mitochondrial [Brachypodium distachyon]XP_014753400.1 nuclear intron maturase 3, mitochondrial [Brachypodium distachyon]XP_014753401.1 nuclear intron maturase 3, mitochondrial [Brachypodium distachyon]XP_014753403.1 nuclear intron maturase 3, mitochondrial [Brachypodium distachyon]XP_024313548.1 nuclear intron maturase 3, mitochondrial [Brachypodium distachyon]KQK16914.1 hypothetical protein BRADI_1g31400v3 [Brachypodium distachyon]|eukprot:XP_003560393.2 nuclear intron maturase 3, mitochondrial [Brachypodium distachyon]